MARYGGASLPYKTSGVLCRLPKLIHFDDKKLSGAYCLKPVPRPLSTGKAFMYTEPHPSLPVATLHGEKVALNNLIG